jgi:DNA ligase-1
MKELETIQKISQVSGKNEKRKLLQDNKDDKRLGELLDAGLNFFRKFYIHKWTMPRLSIAPPSNQHDAFLALLNKLENRQITGNEAKTQVESFFDGCDDLQRDIYSKVLRKDLKAGFSVDTAAEFFPIPTFDVMLATDGKKCKKLNEIINKGVFVSPKLDGYRCLAVIENGEVTLYSRNGSVFGNFPSIEASLLKSFGANTQAFVLDGEIMSDDFQAMQKTAFADKRGTSVGDVKYNVFGALTMSEWRSGVFTLTTSQRLANLNGISGVFGPEVVAVSQEWANTVERVLELEVLYMSQGYEGAMVLPDIPYYKGRSANKLMKFKTMLSQDCNITGMYEGEARSRLEGVMGGLELIQENNAKCECGTGFSDEDRKFMFNNKDKVIGRIAEIKYQELSKDGVMRFPVFVRFRDTGPGTGKI